MLGLPGTEPYSVVLDRMAQAGGLSSPGAPLYYAAEAADGVAGLTAAMERIMTRLVKPCELRLDEPLTDPDQVDVVLDCTVLERPRSDGGGDWRLDVSVSPPTITLLGDVCTRVETEGVGSLVVISGCTASGG